jgi:hypothetical protein
VELNPVVHEEICVQTQTQIVEIPIVRERLERENIYNEAPENSVYNVPFAPQEYGAKTSPSSHPANSVYNVPAVSSQDGEVLGKCRTKILLNGKEQEVDSKEIIWRWP